MGNAFYRHDYGLPQDEIRIIKQETGFCNNQILRLFRRFQALDKDGKGYLKREDLLSVKEIVLNPIGEPIVDMFFQGDRDQLLFKDFANVFAVFRPVRTKTPSHAVNSRDAKVGFLFTLVDTKEDGYFCKEELHDLLVMMMGAKITEDQIRQISERIITEADKEGRGKMSIQDFKEATKNLDIEASMSFISFK